MPGDYGLQNLAIPVPPAAIEELRGMIEAPREEAFRWVSDEFNVLATKVHEDLQTNASRGVDGGNVALLECCCQLPTDNAKVVGR
jgi:hypothetical protein